MVDYVELQTQDTLKEEWGEAMRRGNSKKEARPGDGESLGRAQSQLRRGLDETPIGRRLENWYEEKLGGRGTQKQKERSGGAAAPGTLDIKRRWTTG